MINSCYGDPDSETAAFIHIHICGHYDKIIMTLYIMHSVYILPRILNRSVDVVISALTNKEFVKESLSSEGSSMLIC